MAVECVEKKFGKGAMDKMSKTIRMKVNQKCLDRLNKKIKKENPDSGDKTQTNIEDKENTED